MIAHRVPGRGDGHDEALQRHAAGVPAQGGKPDKYRERSSTELTGANGGPGAVLRHRARGEVERHAGPGCPAPRAGSQRPDVSDFDAELLRYLTPEELAELDQLLAGNLSPWLPLAGPQMDAYLSRADVIGYGGAAGGGKTDLIAGLALCEHQRSLIIRREKAQTEGVVQRPDRAGGRHRRLQLAKIGGARR